ncbi:MAG: biotin transporter BioY [Clostridia bacterium]|nr:biotin transporter BioY [Clostridia bacterium]
MGVKRLVRCAVFVLFISICSAFALPFGAVPLSLGLLALMAVSMAGDVKTAVFAVLGYLLLGIVGLPVFAGFKGGLGVIFGPTGGFLLSYIAVAVIIGFFALRGKAVWGIVLGLLICYIKGTLWFMIVMRVSFIQALSVAVLPFVVPDIIKCILGYYIGKRIKIII